MRKTHKVNSLIRGNPKVDGKQLREAIKLVDALRKQGVKRSEYNLVPPYTSFHETPETEKST